MTRALRSVTEACLLGMLRMAAVVVRALPPGAILPLGRAIGWLLFAFDARGRRVGRQNLGVAFGASLSASAKRRLLVGSFAHLACGLLVVVHASPFTPRRVRRWIDVPPEVDRWLRHAAMTSDGGVLVSAHFGSWELLLGLPVLFAGIARLAFLVQPTGLAVLDRFLTTLREGAGATSIPRRGGARALMRHVAGGGVAALLADRNVRPTEGGVWAPFLGLDAATATLPARLARRRPGRVFVVPVFCVPAPGGRYRLEADENLVADLDPEDAVAFDRAFATRWNRLLEGRVRRMPDAWNWTFMRFKSRPRLELGGYPPYSGWRGPDPWAQSPLARARE